MAGHSHWAGIKHKKKLVDAKRGRLFSKLVKVIISAARHGADPKANLQLLYAIDAAKAANVPKDTIERAILKGSGQLEGEQLESVQYEGYAPAGVAVLVDALTSNRNRTTPLVRKIFERHGGNMGTSGCVAWSFERKGLFIIELGELGEDEAFELVVDAGAEDFQPSGDYYEVTCAVTDWSTVKQKLEENDIRTESAEITMVPKNYVKVDMASGRKAVALMEEMEELDDVENVYSNFDLPEELVAQMANDES